MKGLGIRVGAKVVATLGLDLYLTLVAPYYSQQQKVWGAIHSDLGRRLTWR